MIPASLIILVGLILVGLFIATVVREFWNLKNRVEDIEMNFEVTRNMVSEVYSQTPEALPKIREALEKWIALTSKFKGGK